MGKKYIIEIGRLERLYKAFVSAHGKPGITWLSPEVDLTPYTEPDMEQVRKEAYQKGYETAKHECEDCPKQAYTDAIRMEGYQKGLSDAWDAARTLWNTPTRKEIFGYTTFSTTLTTLTAQETIEKIRQYEQEKEEQIQVGDEVIRHYKNEFMEGDDAPSIFLSEEDGHFRCLAFNGRSIMIAEYPKNQYRKTGRHFPEIAEVLKKMKETNNG